MRSHTAADFQNFLSCNLVPLKKSPKRISIGAARTIGRIENAMVNLFKPLARAGLEMEGSLPIIGHGILFPPFVILQLGRRKLHLKTTLPQNNRFFWTQAICQNFATGFQDVDG